MCRLMCCARGGSIASGKWKNGARCALIWRRWRRYRARGDEQLVRSMPGSGAQNKKKAAHRKRLGKMQRAAIKIFKKAPEELNKAQ
jgi:hypothetical protein